MNKAKLLIYGVLFTVISSSVAFADTQCGPYRLTSGSEGLMLINGVKPETQKMSFLKAKEDYQNMKAEWTVATDQPGRWVGLEYIKRDGKAILNAQWLQASMNAPRQYATYDCMKVK